MSKEIPVNNDCPNRSRNEMSCPCKAVECKNHGKCCDCIQAHREYGSLVACMKLVSK